MTSLLEIRNRIKSVQNVGQITKAMEMIAAALLKKAQARSLHSQRFFAAWQRVMDRFVPHLPREFRKTFWNNPTGKSLYLIIASNRGLCGNYNSSLFRFAEMQLKESENAELYLIGKQTVTHFARRNYPVKEKLITAKGTPEPAEIEALSKQLLKEYLAGIYKDISVMYVHSHSLTSRESVKLPFLPIRLSEKKEKEINYIIEPEPGDLSVELIPRYLQSQLEMIFRNAFAGELSARSFAMKKATNNARDMVDRLILMRNKVRQTNITREMIEITSGGAV
jgi:F-type H+-transporting ATPase subunit gamma